MAVLVACEESQAVTISFRERGIKAFSCDIQPCSGGHPEWHIQGDVLPLLREPWDMIIAFPPCTHLCSSGARWFPEKRADGRQFAAAWFFMQFARTDCHRVAIENPVGIMSTRYRKPDQIIQPWQFGNDESKKTCLWLKNLPKLQPTKIIEPHYGCSCGFRFPLTLGKYGCANCLGKGKVRQIWKNQTPTGQNNIPLTNPDRDKIRSKTYPGIAKAMADQWGPLCAA